MHTYVCARAWVLGDCEGITARTKRTCLLLLLPSVSHDDDGDNDNDDDDDDGGGGGARRQQPPWASDCTIHTFP